MILLETGQRLSHTKPECKKKSTGFGKINEAFAKSFSVISLAGLPIVIRLDCSTNLTKNMSKKRKKQSDEKDENRLTNDLPEKLKKAVKNLFYISETDAEIQPFVGQTASAVTINDILRQTEKSLNEKVEERDFGQLFERLTKIQDWFGDEEKEKAKKFAIVRDLLTENLKDLKVFKVGEVEVEIFIVGLDEQGKLIGVKTKAVET